MASGAGEAGAALPYLLLLNPADVFRVLNVFGLEELRTAYGVSTVFPPALASPWLPGGVMVAWIIAPLGRCLVEVPVRKVCAVAGLAWLLVGCGRGEQRPVVAIVELTDESVCALDGMLLADYPGPKAQIHYAQGAPELYCDTVEMFAMYFGVGKAREIVALYVQDMGSTAWDNPQGNWIDARVAFYKPGSAGSRRCARAHSSR